MKRGGALAAALIAALGLSAPAGAAGARHQPAVTVAPLTPAEKAQLLKAARAQHHVLRQGIPPTGPTNSPFTPGLPSTPLTTTTQTAPAIAPTTTAAGSSGGGLSGGSAVAIGVGALVVLGGISWFIWHDARRRAPVRAAAAAAAAGGGRPGSKKPRRERKLSPAERRRRRRGRAR